MNIAATSTDNMMPTYKRWPIEIVSGEGCTVFDSNGNSYLDFIAGIAVASLGHAHPAFVSAVSEQAARLTHVSNLYETAPQKALAARLAELTGGMHSFFVNSGAEALECAIKLARKHSRRTKEIDNPVIVCAEQGFHGRTLGALAATGNPAKQEPFAPMPEGFVHVPFGDIAAMEEAITDDVAAVLLEPIQGEAGVVVPPEDYLASVAAICEEKDCLLILDEVQTGLGRTGAWFGHEASGVSPDIICLAKGLGGGLPIGACLAAPDIAATFATGDHGSTFGGGPVQCAAALAVLDTIEQEDLVANAARVGKRITTDLLDASIPGAVRGQGLLIGVELDAPLARDVAAAALTNGLLVNDATPSVLRLAPPLILSEAEAQQGIEILKEVLFEVGTA
jgi:acetylornithine/N-succinyldiaminopimelate aminotransferase